MTNRQRFLAILGGRQPDRIPWIPRLSIWYTAHRNAGTLPERYRGWGLRDIERDLGMGTPARVGRVFAIEYEGVEVRTRQKGDMETFTEYVTPVGTISTLLRSSEVLRNKGILQMDVEHLVKGPGDYEVAEYLEAYTRYQPKYEEFLAYDAQIGEDGFPMVNAGDCPFHRWLRDLVGYRDAYFHLNDYPDKVESLLELMTEHDRKALWPVMAESPAKLFLHGAHFDSHMTPPPIYERYILPYYQEFSVYLHRHGKKLCMHADADSRLLLRHIRDSGYDMVETFTTEPMVSCTLEEARRAFGKQVIVWGGVPSTILEPEFSDEYFESFMRNVFRTIAPGDAFILGVADNVMPRARIERLRRVSEMVEAWGDCPVRADAVPG
jgi:hypothetical protein